MFSWLSISSSRGSAVDCCAPHPAAGASCPASSSILSPSASTAPSPVTAQHRMSADSLRHIVVCFGSDPNCRQVTNYRLRSLKLLQVQSVRRLRTGAKFTKTLATLQTRRHRSPGAWNAYDHLHTMNGSRQRRVRVRVRVRLHTGTSTYCNSQTGPRRRRRRRGRCHSQSAGRTCGPDSWETLDQDRAGNRPNRGEGSCLLIKMCNRIDANYG